MSASIRETDGCGAEITGVSVPRASAAEIDLIRQAVFDRGVAFLHGQDLTPEEQIAFAEKIGPIVVNRYFPPSEKYPQIAKVEKTEEQTTNIGGGWHTDHSYDQAPAMGSVLLAVETPPSGGDTQFANMYAAYETLPDALKARVESLSCVHDASRNSAGELRLGYEDVSDPRQTKGAVHPIVSTHAVTGRKCLLLGRRRNAYIVGLDLAESEQLLDALWAHATRPELTWTQVWQVGDLMMWDNTCTMHKRDAFDPAARRLMYRTQIAGVATP